jgi:hypothetical protein
MGPELSGHEAHGTVYVTEEELITFAQVVETWFTIGGWDDPVLGTAAVAGEAHIAFSACERQGVQFVLTELMLLI